MKPFYLLNPLLVSAFILCNGVALGRTPKEPPPPAWDDDLFHKDVSAISAHAEFLYWQPEEGSLDFALKMETPAWSSTADSYAQGQFSRSHFNVSPGFRVGVGYFRAPKGWEVFGFYTRFTAEGHDRVKKPTGANEFLTGSWPQILSTLTQAKTSTSLSYNVVDLLADRFFHPNHHFRLRLLGGLTGAWIHQNWNIRYYDALSNITLIRSRWNFGGAGFRFGLMADWFWTSDIYLTARGTIVGLIGPYSNHTKQTSSLSVNGSNPAIPIRNAKYADTRMVPGLQLLLGPSWQRCFCSTRVEVFAGWELNGWMNLHEVYHSTSGSPSATKETWINSSLLALQGLTTRVSVDF